MKYKALQQGHLQSFYDRREYLCTKLFRQIEQDPCHKLTREMRSIMGRARAGCDDINSA